MNIFILAIVLLLVLLLIGLVLYLLFPGSISLPILSPILMMTGRLTAFSNSTGANIFIWDTMALHPAKRIFAKPSQTLCMKWCAGVG